MGALDVQVGGGHYKQFAIQPTEFAMTEGYDTCCANILKYISRHPDKGGLVDLEKAQHYIALRNQITTKHDLHRWQDAMRAVRRLFGLSWVTYGDCEELPDRADSMDVYIRVNGFAGTPEARALRALHYIHLGVGGSWSSRLDMALTDVLAQYDNPKREFIPAGMLARGLGDDAV